MNLKKLERDLRVNLLGPGPRLIKKKNLPGRGLTKVEKHCSRQNVRRMIKRWMENQHPVSWRGPCSTQRQARELISGPDLATKARLLSFNRTKSRADIGLLIGHQHLEKTFIYNIYIMGLSNKPTCRNCGTEEETSVYILCECAALASLRHTCTHLGSFFFDPEDIRKLSIGTTWNFAKGTGLLKFSTEHGA